MLNQKLKLMLIQVHGTDMEVMVMEAMVYIIEVIMVDTVAIMEDMDILTPMDVTDTILERDLLMLNLKLKPPLIQAHGTDMEDIMAEVIMVDMDMDTGMEDTDIHTDTVTTDTASKYYATEYYHQTTNTAVKHHKQFFKTCQHGVSV